MKTLRNMLFAMLVSPLVFYSAQAGEITLDGSLEVASTKQDGETGNPIGLENEMTLSASTELDNGFSVGYKMTLDADAFEHFKENGIFNKEIDKSFRKNILEKGNTEHPMKMYVKFRGKEPDSSALLRRDQLI